MRVAFDARYANGRGSGIGSYTLNLARALVEADADLELLIIRGASTAPPLVDSPRVREVRFPFAPNSPFTRWLLSPALRSQHFDVYHSPFAVTPSAIHVPVVATIHDVMWMVNPRFISHSRVTRLVGGAFHRASLRATVARADRILTVSEASRQAIAAEWPSRASAIRVAPNGVDTDTFHAMDRDEAFRAIRDLVAPGTRFVLTVGNASPHKNHLNAVRAFAEAFRDRSDWRMILVRRFGRRDAAFSQLLGAPGVAGRVIVLPHVESARLNALYNAAHVYLHPSMYEGFGIPVLEAMNVGTPVVTSNTGALAEVAGDAALLVDPGHVPSIAAALDRLDRDPVERARVITAGRARAAAFTWAACARATISVYREVAADHGRARGGG